ncbi:glycosyltransferase [Corynebacterium zhongnanshanii]|uniref:Glycosyltransferase n=1 Tax=Corynebacterium zhongnanshanii TaxID=2768834 RepID=A0ABQ6VI96_9CORY|nr:glycosyltransferase [Corynebacterium zhongnanshanii]KAB3519961.1 glycosyltransferase [Corynebacterium zhongnanshanii]
MNTLGIALQRAACVCSFSLHHLLTEPRSFVQKIAQRFDRTAPWMQHLAAPGQSVYIDGQLYVNNAGTWERKTSLVREGIGRVVTRLVNGGEAAGREAASIIESPTAHQNAGRGATVAYVLTNSLPFTQSGYSLRSRAIMDMYERMGMRVRGITRLGYPLVIGHLHFPIDDARHNVSRLVGWRYPWSEKKRAEYAAELLVEKARDMQATVLHTTTPYANAQVVSCAARQLGIPWIYEMRGLAQDTWLSRMPAELAEVAAGSEQYAHVWKQEVDAARKAAAVVCISQVIKNMLVAAGVDEEKIFVLPNGVEEQWLQRSYDVAALRLELGWEPEREDTVYIGVISALVGYEGIDLLIEAMQQVRKNIRLVIVGDGEEYHRLVDQVEALKLQDRIRFYGRVPHEEVWKYYAALDALIIPRRDERVTRAVPPMKPLMAMACDKAIIASDLPALKEVTGGRAVYVEPGNTAALAQAIDDVQCFRHNAGSHHSVRPRDSTGSRDSTGLHSVAADNTWQRHEKLLSTVYEFLGQE